ncbi:MAG: hypothetical protein HUK15_05980 [Bacteroidales bacterium]|nr:hypothetical protein [Bacteroidales bacterium]
MKSTKNIDIYVVDNDVLFLDEFSDFFSLDNNHTLYTFFSVQEFLTQLRNNNQKNFKIVIINGLIESKGLNTRSVVEILPMIKNIDKSAGVIILSDTDNLEMKMSSGDIRAEAFIQKDKMLKLKIGPTINRIISQYEMKKCNAIYKTTLCIAIPIIIIFIGFFLIMNIIQ